MKPHLRFPLRPAVYLSAVAALALAVPLAAQTPARLAVDASEAPRKILHAHLVLPAAPGPLTLYYPKWIPGEHGPTGPLVNLVGLKLTAGDKPLAWERDPADMYAFHLTVPAGATEIEADYDFVAPAESGVYSSGASTSANLSVLSWNTVLLYPSGKPGEELPYEAFLKLPAGWKLATPLKTAGEQKGDIVRFAPVSMTTLIDSPVLMAVNLQKIAVPSGPWPPHEIDVATDSASYLAPPPGMAEAYGRLVAEARALFGAHHYTQYHWLLTLSDHVAHFGLEHHEASDNRMPEATLTDEALRTDLAGLLAHEFIHSWNGKYRRPQGLMDPDYHQPMQGNLLWVYEGLTQYLAYVLPPRSGLWTPEKFHDRLAMLVANLDHMAGRTWRPLQDTATGAQVGAGASNAWRTWRRSADYYDESVLIWLEADSILRKASAGKRTLDDFIRRFHGGQSGAPQVVPYTFDDVVTALNEVAPHDWRAFFNERLTSLAPQAPAGGLTASGWRLVYNDTPNSAIEGREKRNKNRSWTYSLGMEVHEDGVIRDVVPGLPAAKAGIGPGMKLVAVNGRAWTGELVDAALRQAKGGSEPIQLLVNNDDFFRTFAVDYHGGLRYPHLERTAGPDVLSEVVKSRAGGR
jgi:predicted metalloprotease with PDZ domain